MSNALERYEKMKVSDYIVSFLVSKQITDVFGYPGGMVTHLMDSLAKYQGQIAAHVNYNEQGSAFCACGYAQTSLRPGVAYATSGPGATNLVTGIANTYFDSIPCLFMTGQVNTYESMGDLMVRQKGFQETDIISIVSTITKYAKIVNQAEDIRYELEKAYHFAISGRPGPVLLDIPMDIQRQDIEPTVLKGYMQPDEMPLNTRDLQEVIKSLETANRPCILVGAGVKTCGMVKEFRTLANHLGIPVVSSMLAIDVLASGDENDYGFIGAYGDRKANFIIAKSDLILSLGSRMDGRQIGNNKENFAPQAKLIRIEVDEGELSNVIKADEQQIVADLRLAIPWLNNKLNKFDKSRYTSWTQVCIEIKKLLSDEDLEYPNRIMRYLSHYIPDSTVLTTDVGQNQVWFSQSFDVKENQQVLFSGGHGAMGYSLPAAIGACYGSGKRVVSFSGDGGIQMNIQELQYIARENLTVKIVIFNNSALGMIRHFQEMYFDSCFMQTIQDKGYSVPSFEKIAAAYELPYYRIDKEDDFSNEMFTEEGPGVIEIVLPQCTYVFPKLAMNKPNQDQEPAISRTVYDYIMNL